MLRHTPALAPMRIPLNTLHLPIPADQGVGARVVFEVGFACGFKFGDDALSKITLEASHNDRQLLTRFAVLQKEV